MTSERILFLTRLDEALRPLTNPDSITATASRLLGEHLEVDRCAYAEVEADEDHFTITGDYTRGDTARIRGRYAMSAFGAEALRLMREDQPYVLDDVGQDPRIADQDRAAYEQTQIQAVISIPLHKDGRFAAGMAVHQRSPRRWHPEEVSLVGAVAQRCWESIERARALRSLRESEERNRLIVEGARDYAILTTDLDGTVESWSPGAEVIFGWSAAEAIGQSAAITYTPEDRAAGVPEEERRLARAQGYAPNVRWHQRKDGSRVFIEGVVRVLRDPDGEPRRILMVGQDVTERGRQEAERERLLSEAEQARREAEAANRAKSQFLANMSHEIRTPINAIVGYTDLLELGVGGDVSEAQRAQLARIRASSEHLVGLVDDVLDLAKVEAGQMRVEQVPVGVASVAEAALALVRPQAERRGIRVVEACADAGDLQCLGDPDRARQIVVNLASNALKFTPGGTITVSCGAVDRPERGVRLDGPGPWAYIRVSDTGIGIPAEQCQAIFEPFVQLSTGHTRVSEGTGLGLSISRHLARLMGGDLTVASELGVGSTFTLWLPTTGGGPPSDVLSLLAETRGHGSIPAGLRIVGERLRPEIDEVLRRYVERVRSDPEIPMAHGLGVAEVEDHLASVLMDVVQTLIVLGASTEVPERLLSDGSEIQRTATRLHGEQRAQLGWSDAAFLREAEIVREEVVMAVRRATEGVPGADVDGSVHLLLGILDQVSRIGLRSLQAARTHPASIR